MSLSKQQMDDAVSYGMRQEKIREKIEENARSLLFTINSIDYSLEKHQGCWLIVNCKDEVLYNDKWINDSEFPETTTVGKDGLYFYDMEEAYEALMKYLGIEL